MDGRAWLINGQVILCRGAAAARAENKRMGQHKEKPGTQGKHEAAQKQPTYSGRAVMLFMKQKTSKTKNRRLGSRMQSTG